MKTYIKGISIVTREFVESVRKPMLETAKELATDKMFKQIVEEFVHRYEKENNSVESVIHFYFQGTFDNPPAKIDALTHSACYKQIICDILQRRLNYETI